MNIRKKLLVWLTVLHVALLAPLALASSGSVEAEAEPEKGPHRGRMLRDGEFAVELSIFETGVPPEFRVWVTHEGKAVAPNDVKLNVKLTRLGNVVDDINFYAQGAFLRGDMEIYEPHSFQVSVFASYQGKRFEWHYDNFEGRTTIETAVAEAMEIQTGIADGATLHQTIPLYGKLFYPPGASRTVTARFNGVITKSHITLGDSVKKGQVLYTVESNESLRPYQLTAPMKGRLTAVFAYEGEQANGQPLLEITDTSTLAAQLQVFPKDYAKVAVGAPVTLSVSGSDETLSGEVTYLAPGITDNQARKLWVSIQNVPESLTAGSFAKGLVEVATIEVELAVKKTGLQGFRDFTVVYAKVGEEYEVRMLELGREDDTWIEVLGGLEPGTEYVTENSYILKADIEKSGASHDH